ncbi:hypothetical protein PMI17_01585 [Pantoea sp. GM01]|nr:hypothetical protein PMI17_01585 [Pantoea sp. GM01]
MAVVQSEAGMCELWCASMRTLHCRVAIHGDRVSGKFTRFNKRLQQRFQHLL